MDAELQAAQEDIRELLELVGLLMTQSFYYLGRKAEGGGYIMKCSCCSTTWSNEADDVGRHTHSCPVVKARATLGAHGVEWMEL